MRILSGIQPSGALHLGNYFGALQSLIALQDKGELFFPVVDWHALTTLKDGPALEARVADLVLDAMALGLSAERACIFRQSDVHEHQALAWMLATVTPMALLERAHSYKDKLARGRAAEVGLFTYPVLMAADILLYNADCVPVGHDQKQHLEITRDIATKFNVTYAPGYDANDPSGTRTGRTGIFRLPEPLIVKEGAQLPGLDGQKMSKSYGNTLEVFSPPAEARKKIMRMQTDSTPIEAPKPAGHPLIELLVLLVEPDEARALQRSWSEGGQGYGHYKKRLVDAYLHYFAEARRRRTALAEDPSTVERVLAAGRERAKQAARPAYEAAAAACGAGRHAP